MLVSGFWGTLLESDITTQSLTLSSGLSRHINYMGEIMMATGLSLLLDYTNPLAWVHPIVYAGLFITRQIQDDKECAKKYGPLWDEYMKQVPYRIIPYVY